MADKIVKEAPEVKPGYKTTEFWLTLAAGLVSYVLANAGLEEGSVALQIAGIIGAILSAIGYSVSRAVTKGAASKASPFPKALTGKDG